MFIETVLNFLGVSLTLYAVGNLYMWISHDKIIKPTVRCPYCKQYIGESVSGLIAYVCFASANCSKALRCRHCSTWQDGREDEPRSDKSSRQELADAESSFAGGIP